MWQNHKTVAKTLSATVIATALSAGAISPAGAAESPKNDKDPVMVDITITGVQIPGMPANQIAIPKLPSLESVLQEGPRYAKQLDTLTQQLGQLIDAQRDALDELTKPERELTNARNNIHTAEIENGKNSDEYKAARQEFKETRNEIKDQAKSGDKEARAALTNSDSKEKQRDASAIRILVTRDRLEMTIDKNGGNEEGAVDPVVENEQLKPTDYTTQYENVRDDKKEEESKKPSESSKPTQESSSNQNDDKNDAAKQESIDRYTQRAASVYSPENPEESALYAFGHYQKPIGVPSLVKPEDEEGYGDLAKMNLRTAIDKALTKNPELQSVVKDLRKAESSGDEVALGAARENLRPLIDAVGKALYNWDDEYKMDSKEAQTIIGENPTPYDLSENPEDQEKFDQFIVDFLTIPGKFAKEAEKNNKKNIQEESDSSDSAEEE